MTDKSPLWILYLSKGAVLLVVLCKCAGELNKYTFIIFVFEYLRQFFSAILLTFKSGELY